MASVPRKKWYHIKWFADEDSKEERKLILKLDLLLVPYAFLAYWTKYMDQSNINNAYVSGLSEDLKLHGNELVRLQTMYIIGAVLGQIPFAYLFTRSPMSWVIPALDIMWGIFTLLQYRVTSFGELMAYRFLVGWFEAAFFPGMHYIFGSWYRADEIGRRGGCFYVGLTLGTLTASLIQAGTSARLDGVHGLAGWRWMYIICAIITIPIGLLGYLVLPGTPDKPNRLVLKQEDIDLAKKRLERAGHGIQGSFTLKSLLNIARNWKFWALLWLDIFFWNGSVNTTTGGYLLWLKSLKKFSTSRINELNAISPALGIFYTLFICFSSDLLFGPAWAIAISHTWNIIGLVILVIWDVPQSALWFAFSTTYSAVAMSSVLYGWVNSELRFSPVERAVALIILNTVSQSTTAWTPLLVFKTVEAPRFTKGYSFVLGNAICLIILAHVTQFFIKREKRNAKRADGLSETSDSDDPRDVEPGDRTTLQVSGEK
ncbi:putative MFS transporter Seo1 [Aspergillus clavatus NRRL 1]|uniref:MFS transporter (Seo1), putative n=1 Tax=Aspergillus clavatus (strain ATCC 1007 / CBS 513.65 / DSM 816 / NCTC 3887 / NRRL 1 / QM 1276 / 107) TaxID=344612 RepID=A1CMY2_ASPCL|nr:MFS transporter (Seo1), putative [Aspergillus clavatus NRRL 1]EAW08919.1 MFS transporter (Seo1), putative [Aspergillus clavatus NRRL 1]